jgi:MFS family permease
LKKEAQVPDEKRKKNILYLGLVSLFTDLSSEMIYPFIPEFLVGLGAKKAVVGLIEGIAESTSSVFRPLFGCLSDKLRNRKHFIYLGYGLSAVSKPFLYLARAWPTVLAVRFSDRVGKAVRTPARDALISTSVSASRKGIAFGLHRAMDTFGAVLGPLVAILVLHLFDNNVRLVFLLSVVPAIVALIFIAFARETIAAAGSTQALRQRKTALRSPPFVIFLISNIIFTLGNSSNAFLILKAREAGLAVALIPVIWVVFNASYSVSSPIFGLLSDKVGRKPIIIASFLYYPIVYFAFAFTQSLWLIWALFGAYGIYYGLSEGTFRAYIADLVDEENRATAYGLFNTGIGLALLPASLIMGAIWDAYGSKWAFLTSAGFSLLGFLTFLGSLTLKGRSEVR